MISSPVHLPASLFGLAYQSYAQVTRQCFYPLQFVQSSESDE